MAELKDFKLILSRLILLLSYLCVTEIVIIGSLRSPHHHRILMLISSHEGLIVLESRLLHILHGLHCHRLYLVLDIIDHWFYSTQGLKSL